MTTVFVRDELRASIEGATGGQCTVLYSAQGMPSYFHVIPRFNLEDIDASLGAGAHPAFVINGQEVSRLFIGMFQGVVKNAELLSLPGLEPSAYISFESAAQYARNCGGGFHLMTNAEWAAIALWCYKNNWLPSGNDDRGRNYIARHETGVRADGLAPGDAAGTGVILTGSGPNSWRHNNQPSGIADLVGNLREWVAGLRLVEGELQVFPNNDAAAFQGNFHTAAEWKAIKLSNSTLVNPGTTGTVKWDSAVAAPTPPVGNVGAFSWSSQIVHKLGPEGSVDSLDYNGLLFADIETTAPTLLKTLALAPIGAMDGMGKAYGRNYGTRYFSRGERSVASATGVAGLFSMDALDPTSYTRYYTGGRVAKY